MRSALVLAVLCAMLANYSVMARPRPRGMLYIFVVTNSQYCKLSMLLLLLLLLFIIVITICHIVLIPGSKHPLTRFLANELRDTCSR